LVRGFNGHKFAPRSNPKDQPLIQLGRRFCRNPQTTIGDKRYISLIFACFYELA